MKEAEPIPEARPESVGKSIAAARQSAGLELEDIAERTRIPLRHLKAIEGSDFEALPATTYSAGFVKTFALSVGLDGEQSAARFRAERGEALEPKPLYMPYEPADPSRVPPKLLVGVALLTAILLTIAYMIWRGGISAEESQRIASGLGDENHAGETSAVGVITPHPPRPQAPAEQTIGDRTPVILTATNVVWLKVSEKNGATLFMGSLKAGESYAVPVNARDPRLLTGRPQAVSVRIGDRTIAALGTGDKTISDVSLKAPALIARADAIPLHASSSSPSASSPADPEALPVAELAPAGSASGNADQANSATVAPMPRP